MITAHIPHDVLHSIFECVATIPWAPPDEARFQRIINVPMPFPWIDMSTITACSHVCRLWRETSLATRICWTTIVINVDGDDDDIEREAEKLQTRLIRARNGDLNVILLNEDSNASNFSARFTQLLIECIQQATTFHARFVHMDVGAIIYNALSYVPNLEGLALWQIDVFEAEFMDIDAYAVCASREFLPESYLQVAPKLQFLHTRAIPHCDPENEHLRLPSIQEYIFDDAPGSVGVLNDYGSLLRSFDRLTHFTFLANGSHRGLITGTRILFASLEYLAVASSPASTFFAQSPWIDAPKLQTVCYHIESHQSEPAHDSIRNLATYFRGLSTSPKRFILNGFGLDLVGGLEVDSLTSSHVRCFQILDSFDFVHILEFHRCVFSFTATWNEAWLMGLLNIAGSSLFVPWEDEGNIVREANLDVSVDVRSLLQSVSQTLARALEGPLPYTPSLPSTFMSHLNELSFADCSLVDEEGALEFADVLAIRQKILKQKPTNDSCCLRSINICKMAGPTTTRFVNRLKGGDGMEDVVVVSTAE